METYHRHEQFVIHAAAEKVKCKKKNNKIEWRWDVDDFLFHSS